MTAAPELEICAACEVEVLPDRSIRFVTKQCIERHRRDVDARAAQPLSVFEVPDVANIDRCWEQPRKTAEDIILSDVTRVRFAINVGLDGRVTHASANSLSMFAACSEEAITSWQIAVPPGTYTFEWQPPERR